MSFTRLFISVLFLLVSTNVLAKGETPQISEVLIDLDNNQLIISGSGFDNPDIRLGGYPDLLTLDSEVSDANFLVVDLPDAVDAGDYRLTVSQGKKGKDQDDYDLTFGAVGPQGERGPKGDKGDPGAQGPAVDVLGTVCVALGYAENCDLNTELNNTIASMARGIKG